MSVALQIDKNREQLKFLLDALSKNAELNQLKELLSVGPSRKLEISDQGIVLHLKNDDFYFRWISTDPRTAISSLVAVGTYETTETRILKAAANLSKVIFDIGANVGYYAVVLGKSLPSDGMMYCFEPLPSSANECKHNVYLNDLGSNVKIVEVGLSDLPGKAEIFLPETSGTSAASMRRLHPEENNITHEITLITLDDFVQQNYIKSIDLIKIDVEGAELLALTGGWKSITEFKPIVFAELLRKWSAGFGYHPNQVVDLFFNLGYKCFGVGDEMIEILEINEDTIPTNFVFTPPTELGEEFLFKLNHEKI